MATDGDVVWVGMCPVCGWRDREHQTLPEAQQAACPRCIVRPRNTVTVLVPQPYVPRDSLTEAEPPRHDPPDVAYDLRFRLNNAVRWLRRAEDIARVERPGWPTADRIRDIYEQVSDDVLNGKVSVPPLKQRLTEAERRVGELKRALKWIGYPDTRPDYMAMETDPSIARRILSTDPARPTEGGS
jgi:hypothetical protein